MWFSANLLMLRDQVLQISYMYISCFFFSRYPFCEYLPRISHELSSVTIYFTQAISATPVALCSTYMLITLKFFLLLCTLYGYNL